MPNYTQSNTLRDAIEGIQEFIPSENAPQVKSINNFQDEDIGKTSSLTPSNSIKKFSDIEVSTVASSTADTDRFSKQRSRTSFPTIEEEGEVLFVEPDEGTPAAAALAANAAVNVSSLSKGLRKIPLINKSLNLKKAVSKRFKTKKQKRKNHFSRNFKGKVIDGVHELYTLTAGMMLGMRCSIGIGRHVTSRHLSLDDFSYAEKLTFPPDGNNKGPHPTPPHKLAHTFKMKTYAPLVFRRLRDFFGIDPEGYMSSVCGDYNFLEFISNSKSGQFFFYSHDGRYMIKTQTSEETKFLTRILPHYYKYVTENPDTLLVRFLGIHRVKMYHLKRKVHFVIMGSVFDTPEAINVIYDLKGSLVGRRSTPAEREKGGVLKDLDLMEDGVRIRLGPKRDAFLAQLRRDSDFLAQHNIMDYSLLVGMHDRNGRRGSSSITLTTPRTDVIPLALPSPINNDKRAPLSEPLPRPRSTSGVKNSGASSHHLSTAHNHSHSNTPFRRMGDFNSPRPRSVDTSLGAVVSNRSLSERQDSSGDPGPSTTTGAGEGSGAGTAGAIIVQEKPVSNSEIIFQKSSGVDIKNAHTAELKSSSSGDYVVDHEELVMQLSAVEEGEEDDDESDDEEHFDEGDSVLGSDVEDNATPPESPPHVEKASSEELLAIMDKALDEEGRMVARLFRDKGALETLAKPVAEISSGKLTMTFGPGNSGQHPWTSRLDGGINGHDQNGRTNIIYFAGIIDILQQYTARKRVENFVKGFKHDRKQISAVDSQTYAKRFVEFMEANII